MRTEDRGPIDETLGPLNDVVQLVIRGQMNPSTAWRWITRGIAGENGERIRLQAWYVGRRPYTTPTAVREFIQRVTAARLASLQHAHLPNTDVSDAELAAVGLDWKGVRK